MGSRRLYLHQQHGSEPVWYFELRDRAVHCTKVDGGRTSTGVCAFDGGGRGFDLLIHYVCVDYKLYPIMQCGARLRQQSLGKDGTYVKK